MVTILAALAVGLSVGAAVEFSFLLGLLTLSAATAYDALKHGKEMLDTFGVVAPVVGFIFAFVFALLAVKWLVTYLQRHGLEIFGWYRLGIAALTLILLATHADLTFGELLRRARRRRVPRRARWAFRSGASPCARCARPRGDTSTTVRSVSCRRCAPIQSFTARIGSANTSPRIHTATTRVTVPPTLSTPNTHERIRVAPASRQIHWLGSDRDRDVSGPGEEPLEPQHDRRAGAELLFHPPDRDVAVAAPEPVEERIRDDEASDGDADERHRAEQRSDEHEIAKPRIADDQEKGAAPSKVGRERVADEAEDRRDRHRYGEEDDAVAIEGSRCALDHRDRIRRQAPPFRHQA